MANNHFLRHLANQELTDTIFFATGYAPVKEKLADRTVLREQGFEVCIFTDRRIEVNGIKCRSIPEAKRVIQRHLI